MIQLKSGVTYSIVGDTVVVIDIENDTYFSANELAGVVLESLDSGFNFNEIVGKIVSEYDVKKKKCEKDVKLLLDQLIEKSLVERVKGEI